MKIRDALNWRLLRWAARAAAAAVSFTGLATLAPRVALAHHQLPGRPAAPTLGTTTNNSIQIRWEPPSDTGGLPIRYYDLVRHGIGERHQFRRSNITGTSTTWGGLGANTEHRFRVCAGNDDGEGPCSGWSHWTTGTNDPPAFTSPDTISIDENGTTVLTVAASDPDAGDDRITFSVSGGADEDLFSINSSSGALRFLQAPDFENPQGGANDNSNVYEVEVSATGTNPDAPPDRAKTASRIIRVTVTNVPDNAPGPVVNLRVTAERTTQLELAWGAPLTTGDTPINDYDVDYRVLPSGNWQVFNQGNTLSAVIANLMPSTRYQFRVRAENTYDPGPWRTVQGTTGSMLQQVTGVVVTPEVRQLAVSWNPVMDSQVQYRLQWKSGSQDYGASRQAEVTDTSHTISGLTAGTTYTVRVIAFTTLSISDGPPSAEVTGLASPPRRPGGTHLRDSDRP